MFRILVLILYILIITGLSLLPASSLPMQSVELFPHADKAAHFLMYSGLSFLLFFTWPVSFSGKIRQFIPLLIIFTWGTLMEIFQAIGPHGRHFSYLDIVANTLGFFPGWIMWNWITKRLFPGLAYGQNRGERG
jgi:VanZ family protein